MCSVLKRQGYGEGFRWGPIFFLLLLCCLQWRIFPFVTVVFNNIFSGGFHNIWTNLSRRQHCFWYRFWMREGGRLNTFKFWCLVMNILCKVITETTTSDYSYPVRSVLRWYSNSGAIFTAHKFDLWKLLLGLAKIIRIDKKTNLLGKKAISKKKQQLSIDHSIVHDCEIELLQLELVFNEKIYWYRKAVKYHFDPRIPSLGLYFIDIISMCCTEGRRK